MREGDELFSYDLFFIIFMCLWKVYLFGNILILGIITPNKK